MEFLLMILLLGVFGLPLIGFVLSIGIYVFGSLYHYARSEFA